MRIVGLGLRIMYVLTIYYSFILLFIQVMIQYITWYTYFLRTPCRNADLYVY